MPEDLLFQIVLELAQLNFNWICRFTANLGDLPVTLLRKPKRRFQNHLDVGNVESPIWKIGTAVYAWMHPEFTVISKDYAGVRDTILALSAPFSSDNLFCMKIGIE